MLFIEARKKWVIKKAYKQLHKQFPNNTFLVYWQPHADGFFVDSNDRGLCESKIFTDFSERIENEVFRRAGFSVWIGFLRINGKTENVHSAQEAQEAVPAGS